MKKSIALLLALAMVLAFAGCGKTEAPATVVEVKEPTAEEYAAWAEANGYVLKSEVEAAEPAAEAAKPELATSATEQGGGINYGGIPWTDELKTDAIKEFLKGGTAIADPAYAQDDTGYNYRNMMQMATSYNDMPNCSNLELVLNTEKMTLCGISEAGTSKTIEFLANPNVCVSWSRQIGEADEAAGYDYFGSYGLSYYGTVRNYTVDDLATTEGEDAVIRVFDTYYNTGASFWAGYSANFAQLTDETEIRAAKLAYISNTLASGRMLAYEIVPTRVVLTAPFLVLLVPQYSNGIKYTQVQEGEDKYAYDMGISDAFMDELVAYKAEYLSDADNVKAVEEYYAAGMFAMLDPMITAQGMPAHIDMVKDTTHAAGLMTQVTYPPAA